MRRLTIIFSAFLLLSMITIVLAADFTPQGNINLRDVYNITNVPYFNGTDINISGEFSGPINWTNLQNYPASCPADTFVTQIGDAITCTGISDVYLLNSGDTATGNYTFDTNTLFIDSTANEVGIGTTTPMGKLNIEYANNAVDGLFLTTANTSDSSSPRIYFYNGSKTGGNALVRQGTAFQIYTGSTPGSTGTSRFVLDDNGLVGIGIGGPSEMLHIFNSSTPDISIETNTANDLFGINFLAADSSNRFSIKANTTASTTTDKLFFNKNSGSVMTLVGDGNVGIGTTSPLSTLHLQSATPVLRLVDSDDTTNNLQITTTSTQSQLTHTQTTGSIVIDINPVPSDGSSTAPVRLFRNTNTSGQRGLQFLRGDGTTTIDHFINAGTGGVIFNEQGIDSDFRIEGVGASSAFFVQGSDGQVGIGTTNPSTVLNVVGNVSFGLSTFNASGITTAVTTDYTNIGTAPSYYLANFNARNSNANITGSMSGIRVFATAIGSSTVASLRMIEVASPTITGTATQSIGLYINNLTNANATNRWAIYTTAPDPIYFGGNVGIGTSTPGYALEVVDSAGASPIVFSRSGGTGKGELSIDNVMTGSTGDMWFKTQHTGADSGGYAFYVETGSGTQFAMGIDKNKRVGIGTTSPASNLHVSYDGIAVNSSLISSDIIVLTANNTAPGFAIIASSNTAGHRAVFKGTRTRGNLTNPEVPILNDDALTFLSTLWDGDDTQATAGIFFKVDGTVSNNTAPQRISFVTSETTGAARTEKVTIKANGFFGINTTTPQNILNVVGAANFTSNVSAGGGLAGRAMCWKADGVTLGYCSSVVDINGACTCN